MAKTRDITKLSDEQLLRRLSDRTVIYFGMGVFLGMLIAVVGMQHAEHEMLDTLALAICAVFFVLILAVYESVFRKTFRPELLRRMRPADK